jgi:hypothetical protein
MSDIDYETLSANYENFIKSYNILDSLCSSLKARRPLSQTYFDKFFNNCFESFSPTNTNKKKVISDMYVLCNAYKNLPREQKFSLNKPNDKFAKKYNNAVKFFRKELCPNSRLSGITYIPIVYEDHIEIIEITHDILTGDEIVYGEKTLRLSDDKFIKYESDEYFNNCLNHYVGESTCEDIFFKTKLGKYLPLKCYDMHRNTYEQLLLKINFTDNKTGLKHYVYSDDNKLQKLIGGYIYQFKLSCDKKISQLIGAEWNNDKFKFVIIDCNQCKTKKFALKKDKYECTVCKFEMCGKGCGRYYHGNLKCDSESPEMTAYLMKSYINSQCPKCKQYLEKIDGCNHMTCVCKTQYCNNCGKEFEKDSYGHYKVSEHFISDVFNGADSDDEEDMNRRRALARERKVCQQFPVIRNETNISMPQIREITRIL